jgi:mannonate dehydratase
MSDHVSGREIPAPLLPPPWDHGDAGRPRIRNVRVILTAPEGIRLVVVKIETDEPDLYGLGCATFTQRPLAVATAIEQYVKPQVVGRSVHDIEDIWSMLAVSSYWRSGPVLNNAMSGIDMALWDIKGKLAGMPLYDLLGGRCRTAATVYVHASGRDPVEVEDKARGFMEQGFTHVRCQVAVPGSSTYGVSGALDSEDPHPAHLRLRQESWDPSAYARVVPALFEHLRLTLGDRVELLHDIHERAGDRGDRHGSRAGAIPPLLSRRPTGAGRQRLLPAAAEPDIDPAGHGRALCQRQ